MDDIIMRDKLKSPGGGYSNTLEYSTDKEYSSGDLVLYNNDFWKYYAESSSTGNIPVDDSEYWQRVGVAKSDQYWWKRRPFEKKVEVTTTSDQHGSSFSKTESYTAGTGYEVNQTTGEITLTGVSTYDYKSMSGKYTQNGTNSVIAIGSLSETSNYTYFYYSSTIRASVVNNYLGDFQYICSPDKNAYPTTDGAELDNYQYYYLGNSLKKSILISNSTDAENIVIP